VVPAIENDPSGVASALSGYLDYDDIQQKLEPDPVDLERSIETLTSEVEDLASGVEDVSSAWRTFASTCRCTGRLGRRHVLLIRGNRLRPAYPLACQEPQSAVTAGDPGAERRPQRADVVTTSPS
jgi:hypothetical protein